MKRKIIRQGNHSYTLTLPIDWIREQEIQEGQEVDLEQEAGSLLINLPKDRDRHKQIVFFDISKLKEEEERTIKNILNQAYRKGYDTIRIRTKSQEEVALIADIVKKSLLGFDTMEEKNKIVVAASIAEPSSDNYQTILNKLFFIIKVQIDGILTDIKTGKAHDLARFETTKDEFDNYTNFLRRIIVKHKIGGSKDSYMHYMMVGRLSLVCHSYYYLYKFLASQKSFKASKEVIALYADVASMFELLRQAYFDNDFTKAHQMAAQKKKLLNGSVYSLIQTKKGVDNVILYHLGEIIRLNQMISTSLFGLFSIPEELSGSL